MHSLALMMPVWLLCLSLFHYSVVLHRFQAVFETLTPSVFQRYLTRTLIDDNLIFSMHPPEMMPGITGFLNQQLTGQPHDYTITILFYEQDQQTLCWNHCRGVGTTLSFSLYGQGLSFFRHYQLVTT